ncbi:LytTR family DNA-binding domain-containing protein [Clostridium boliviensis]|uniref:Stage 0 sporulation protein A homolog n=1 Tax=Clostridium boliviensis TaxID=318465 RepID=A0ABU4GKD4_9CLOT|nr:LytTR family DNA-binding domain-containing protein [Clostridium boliviensis]MDW2798077.1 LytTR family DNA-binding domain-containing protein [Clostridium boliviensis]
MIKIAICDDEPIFIEQIKSMIRSTLSETHISYLTDSFTSGESLCEKLKGGTFYDLAFLDISMNGMNGIEAGARLRNYFKIKKTIIIYISSYDNRAKEVFCLDTFRFLSKPIDPELFKKDLLSACKRLSEIRDDFFCFKDIIRGKCNIPIEDIIYYEISKGHKINVITKDINYVFYGKLTEVSAKLETQGFLLIHHSILINYNHIRQISYDKVIMSNEAELAISGPKRKEIRTKYLQLRKNKEDNK